MTNLPPIIKIVPMPGPAGAKGDTGAVGPQGPAGTGGGVSSTVPFELNDTSDNLLLSITKTGTGTTRIETPQDDLSLRSARDITLYPGSEGPGKVYIGWGDAEYTPNSGNEVATKSYVDDATGLSAVKYVLWQYPTEGAIAIQNAIDGEAISLKSSDSAAVRWHIRDGGPFVGGATVNAVSIIQQTGEMGVGPYQVQFSIDEQDSVLPVGYYYQINQQGPWAGAYIATAATINTLTLEYPGPNLPGGNQDFTGATVSLPSVYSQVEANEDGIWIKNANWSSGPDSYSNNWHFTNDGSIHFPYGYVNQRTGYGDVLRFASSVDQAIITGPAATELIPNANRLIVAGQDGYDGPDYDGEGGDIYLWAGRGGGTTGDGGDIKIDGGNGAVNGQGGYVKVRGGYSENSTGGYVYITAGDSYTANGGSLDISAGDNSIDTGAYGGTININGGYSANVANGGSINLTTSQSGKITLNGNGGEFLNDPSVPGNQIATLADLPSRNYVGTYGYYGPYSKGDIVIWDNAYYINTTGVNGNAFPVTEDAVNWMTLFSFPAASGTFISQDGKTITVTSGIITSIV